MKFTSESYREAATEHLSLAQWLHSGGRYYHSHYMAGLAFECMLRAYILKVTFDFEARHDLWELARESRFFDSVPAVLHQEFAAAFSALNRRWRSTQRYASPARLWDYLSELKLDRSQKGDPFKNLSRARLNLALKTMN